MSYDSDKTGKDIGMDLNTLVIWQIGVVFTIATIVTTILLYGLYLRVENAEIERKLYTPRLGAVSNVKLEQVNQITRYSWVDPDNDLVTIPIDLAMVKTLSDLKLQRKQSLHLAIPPVKEFTEPEVTEDSTGEENTDHGK